MLARMRRILLPALLLALCTAPLVADETAQEKLAAPTGNDQLTLTDGSRLRGKIITLVGERLMFSWRIVDGTIKKKIFSADQFVAYKRKAYAAKPSKKADQPVKQPRKIDPAYRLVLLAPRRAGSSTLRRAAKALSARCKGLGYKGLTATFELAGDARLVYLTLRRRWTAKQKSQLRLVGSVAAASVAFYVDAAPVEGAAPRGFKWLPGLTDDKRYLVRSRPRGKLGSRKLKKDGLGRLYFATSGTKHLTDFVLKKKRKIIVAIDGRALLGQEIAFWGVVKVRRGKRTEGWLKSARWYPRGLVESDDASLAELLVRFPLPFALTPGWK